MINFELKYIHVSIFINTLLSSTCEIPSYFISGLVYEKLGIKVTLLGFYGMSILGSIAYLIVKTENNILIAIMILFTKFGISGTFNIAYLANADYFQLFLDLLLLEFATYLLELRLF